MPTYEYACKGCGEHLEVVQSFHDGPFTVCSNCGGELRKVFGNIGIVFKGSGFYKTDSRSTSSAAKTSSSDTSASASPEPKTETSKETKKSDSSKSDSSPAPASSAPAPASSTPKAAAS
ncbi:MAG: FmdB family zinc ribbon protein [Acidimicrobiales bacterium]|jgi:putative FmdB family regulatory protein